LRPICWRLPVILLLALAGLGGPSAASAQEYSISAANLYAERKDWAELVRYCREWTQAEPKNPLAWYYLGETYGIGLKQPKTALAAFRQAAGLRASWPEAWDALGHVYAQLVRYQDSASAFRHAAQQNPKKLSYWNNLAAAYADENQRDLAEKTLEDGQQAAGPYASFVDWYRLGNGYYKLNQFRKAIVAYEHCLHLNRKAGPAWNNLGAAQREVGKAEEALRDFQHASVLGDPLGKKNYLALQNTRPANRGVELGESNDPPLPDTEARAYTINHPEALWTEALAPARP
jgi:tetratricopeptide (TPR) repeat protein